MQKAWLHILSVIPSCLTPHLPHKCIRTIQSRFLHRFTPHQTEKSHFAKFSYLNRGLLPRVAFQKNKKTTPRVSNSGRKKCAFWIRFFVIHMRIRTNRREKNMTILNIILVLLCFIVFFSIYWRKIKFFMCFEGVPRFFFTLFGKASR